MKIAVKDANILIDMAVAGLLESWFQLGIVTCTTDLVYAQVLREAQAAAVLPFVESGLLEVVPLDGEMMLRAAAYRAETLGIEDASVLFLAHERKAVLLSGDRAVVNTGRLGGLEVRGILWIFDLLIERSVLNPGLAAIKLRQVIQSGTFLPKAECEVRLERWGNSRESNASTMLLA